MEIRRGSKLKDAGRGGCRGPDNMSKHMEDRGLIEESQTWRSDVERIDTERLDDEDEPPEESEEAELEALIDEDPDLGSLIVHKPQSPEDKWTIRTTTAIVCEGAADVWYAALPSRFGHNKAVDSCIEALVSISDFDRGLPGITLQQCYRALSFAFQDLRVAMSDPTFTLDDDCLVAIGTLAPAEGVLGRHGLLGFSHFQGMMGVLSSRPADWKPSELTRNVVDYCFSDSFVVASVNGTVSPLERLDQMAYGACNEKSTDHKLRTKSNELCMQLPRLITYVRQMRTAVDVVATKATTLAARLLKLKDESAENEVLHRVNIIKTVDSADAKATKFSFSFKTNADYETATRYWQARLALLRLCWRLPESQTIPPKVKLQAEMRRLCSNILMCVQYGRKFKIRGRRRLLALSMITVWGMLNDAPNALSENVVLAEAREWLKDVANQVLIGRAALGERDMDDAAELFVGGASEGAYAELYGKHDDREKKGDAAPVRAKGKVQLPSRRRASTAKRGRMLMPAG